MMSCNYALQHLYQRHCIYYSNALIVLTVNAVSEPQGLCMKGTIVFVRSVKFKNAVGWKRKVKYGI